MVAGEVLAERGPARVHDGAHEAYAVLLVLGAGPERLPRREAVAHPPVERAPGQRGLVGRRELAEPVAQLVGEGLGRVGRRDLLDEVGQAVEGGVQVGLGAGPAEVVQGRR